MRGRSGAAVPLPIPAVSGHFPTTPHLNGPRQPGQEADNEAILHRASMPLFLKGKNSSRAVGLGKFFLWRQLIISPINTAAYYLPTVVRAKWWKVMLLSIRVINRQMSP